MLRSIFAALDAHGKGRQPEGRGFKAQKEKRKMEQVIRKRTVTAARYLKRLGLSHPDAARMLGMKASTLALWKRRWRNERLDVKPRGRPPERPERIVRNQVIEVIALAWPYIGLPTLQAVFPEIAKRELEDLLRRFWRLRLTDKLIHSLSWRKPGAVWAMDFHEPSTPVDGIYPFVLAVRDLASGMSLAWMPVPDKSAEQARALLEDLFLRFGAPIVIKADNEGAFRACRNFLAARGVCLLLSPARYPEYNGACEAGIGALKTYSHHQAVRCDRPGKWTCNDVEAARLRANRVPHLGPAPEEKWRRRRPVTAAQRNAFHAAVQRHRQLLLEEVQCAEKRPPAPEERAVIERSALERALAETGLLVIRRRRITPPFSRRKRSKIS